MKDNLYKMYEQAAEAWEAIHYSREAKEKAGDAYTLMYEAEVKASQVMSFIYKAIQAQEEVEALLKRQAEEA